MKTLDPKIWPPQISGVHEFRLVVQRPGEPLSVPTFAIIGKAVAPVDNCGVSATDEMAAYFERCLDIAPRSVTVIGDLMALLVEMKRRGARLPEGAGEAILAAHMLIADATEPIKGEPR